MAIMSYLGILPPKAYFAPIYRVMQPALGASTDFPSENDVRDGISYASGTFTGNMTEPAESDVKSGVQYGANGTEFTGTMAVGGGERSYSSVD